MKEKMFYLTFIAFGVCSCGDGASSSRNSYDENPTNYEYYGTDNSENLDNNGSGMAQQMYLCPMCQGNRQISHYYTGEIMVCPACQGTGQVTAEIVQQLQEASQMGEDLANGALNGGGCSSGGYSRSRDAIEMELEQCELEKASVEEQMEYVESVTSRSYLSSQLSVLNTRINQLRRELQYAD
ncbi:MAG: hypothetical protein ACI3ZB_02330 [Prevotella sp.]